MGGKIELEEGCKVLSLTISFHGHFLVSTKLSPTQKSLSHPDLLSSWLTCDIHYEADRVFAHAGAGVQAWILGRGITDLQHLLIYQRAIVGAQRTAVFGPDDGPRCRQRAAQLQHIAWVHWAHRGLRNLVFVRRVCRVNGSRGGADWRRKRVHKKEEVGEEETSHSLRNKPPHNPQWMHLNYLTQEEQYRKEEAHFFKLLHQGYHNLPFSLKLSP